MDLSQRVYGKARHLVYFASLWSLTGSIWAVPGIVDVQCKHCSGCGGGRALDGGIYKDFKVATKSFAFSPYSCTAAATRLSSSLRVLSTKLLMSFLPQLGSRF